MRGSVESVVYGGGIALKFGVSSPGDLDFMRSFHDRLAIVAALIAVFALGLLTTACSSRAAEQAPAPASAAAAGGARGGAQGPVPVTVATVAQQSVPLDIQ